MTTSSTDDSHRLAETDETPTRISRGEKALKLFGLGVAWAPPSLPLLVYVNGGGVVLTVLLFYAFRNRFRRRRFRITEREVSLPSIARVGEAEVATIDLDAIEGVEAIRARMAALGTRANPVVRIELRVRLRGQGEVLVWPANAFETKNFEALQRRLASTGCGA